MRYFILIMLVVLIGCGDDHHYHVSNNTTPQSFDGYFLLDGASDANCVRFTQKTETLVDLETECQSLLSTNPENDTIAQHPVVALTNLIIINGKMIHSRNINYLSGHDIEQDVNGSNITGNHRTDFIFEFVDDKLKLTIKIFDDANNNNINKLVATRVFNEL
ncbi:MAG: hypothetical protein HWN79_17675 [Candidatus Lokiarchaeota archaeon]|nr:hypothetical protein [Candidatus Lokiarchaeota archaeon]